MLSDRPAAAVADGADLTLPRVAANLDRTARAAAFFSVVTGTAVLLGWAFEIDVLKRLMPGLTAMNPVTAAAFLLLGGGLAHALPNSPPHMRRISVALGAVVMLIGLARLSAVLGIADLGVDRLIFPEKLAGADFGRANQMAPNTALNLALLGGALALMDRRIGRVRRPTQLFAVTAAMASLLALMGYAYGLRSFYGVGTNGAMSLPTALAFLAVSIGVLCVRPAQGIMTVIASDSSGGTMIRRLLPAVIVVPAVLGGLRIAGYRLGWVEGPFSLWLLVVVIMTVFVILVAWNAQLLFLRDIERAASEKTMTRQAMHDPLTRLPNRRLFMLRLRRELEQAKDSGTFAAVLFVDIDRFKIINDSLGHIVGDELLTAAGVRIQNCVEPPAIVGHLSGDEFMVLVPGLESREPAIALARTIRQAFDTSFSVGPYDVVAAISVGIAFSTEAEDAVNLVRHADIAMYRAKARGRARHEIFDPSMDLAIRERLRLEVDLRHALDHNELRVYYQPEVEIDTGRLVGMEALVRWEHPERGLISPDQFIAVAEETGLIVPIGRWVLREACRQAKEWQERYRPDLALMVAVNLSGKHLQQTTLIDEVRDVLTETGIVPSSLILEITETVAMAGAETTIEILTRLKALGVKLAIDDFGTGFSSLAYLKRFPVDLLKIDKSFVDGVAHRGHDTRIVEAIIALGHALGLRVIAEGVETTDQLLELRALGSELGQGYYFGRPLSSDVDSGMPPLLAAERRFTSTAGE